ncbi:LacI family DNA-binding transcriptional regulator [Streptomyces antimycoticus]|uniref:LacI family DNA-binding transcriptional regulator n=1 Tax=Streptomyces antimycoticus TaxID=68175 RepID=UPI0036ABCB7A
MRSAGSAHGLMRTTPDSAGAPTVTIRDVARVAGVSYRTVSGVINGHGSASAKAPARTAAPAAERQAENRPPSTRREPGAAPASRPRTALAGMRGTLRRQRC